MCFDRSQDAALLLPAKQSAGAPSEQLQQRRIGGIQAALGHNVPRKLLRGHRPRRVSQGASGNYSAAWRVAGASMRPGADGWPSDRHWHADRGCDE
jgi:hypothetical protein